MARLRIDSAQSPSRPLGFLIVLLCSHSFLVANAHPLPNLPSTHTDNNPRHHSPITNYRPSSVSLNAPGDSFSSNELPSFDATDKKADSSSASSSQPEKSSTLSILSVIHPALQAAFSSEKSQEKLLASEPITKVEYLSSPLRGTEARDRAAFGLSTPAPPNLILNSNQNASPDSPLSLSDAPSLLSSASDHKVPSQDTAMEQVSSRQVQAQSDGDRLSTRNQPLSPVNSFQSSSASHLGQQLNNPANSIHSSASKIDNLSGSAFLSSLSGSGAVPSMNAGGELPSSALSGGPLAEHNPAGPIETSFSGLGLGRDATARLNSNVNGNSNRTTDEGNPSVATSYDTFDSNASTATAAHDALESVWKRMVSTVKQTVGSVLAPSLSSNTEQSAKTLGSLAASSRNNTTTPDKQKSFESYTPQEIDDLVSDILHQLHMHQEDMRAHREMLRSSGQWDPDSPTQGEIAKSADIPILVLRSNVIVSPEALADAVTESTKKLLLARGSPVPWPIASRLLVDVHSRLVGLVEPVEAVKRHSAPSPSVSPSPYPSHFHDVELKKKYIGTVVNSVQSRIRADTPNAFAAEFQQFQIPHPNPYDTTLPDLAARTPTANDNSVTN